MEWITDPASWVALLTLTMLEIVLGVDNIIFLSIMTGKLPPKKQPSARTVGLLLAMLMRVALLFSLSWLMRLTSPLFTVIGNEISGRDLILLLGGAFLLFKSTREIHEKLEGDEQHSANLAKASFGAVIAQIVALDVVFSLDSVITAIGMANQLAIMVIAVILAVGFMLFSAKAIGVFIEKHPTIKMLALSFLLLIGLSLIAEGLDQHVPKGYIYFAMGFSVFVEMLNTKSKKKKAPPVRLRKQPAAAN